MIEKDTKHACGTRHSQAASRRGYRWRRGRAEIGFHAGKIDVERPGARALCRPQTCVAELGAVDGGECCSTSPMRELWRTVRLPEGDVPASAGSRVSKSAASRHGQRHSYGNGWRRTFRPAGGASRRSHQGASSYPWLRSGVTHLHHRRLQRRWHRPPGAALAVTRRSNPAKSIRPQYHGTIAEAGACFGPPRPSRKPLLAMVLSMARSFNLLRVS
jgi:hypothetical protein